MQLVGGVDGRGATFDVGDLRPAIGDDHVALEWLDLGIVRANLGLERDADRDAGRDVEERSFGPEGGVQGRNRIVVRRDDGGQIRSQGIRNPCQGRWQSIESDAARLEIGADRTIGLLGRLEGSEAGQNRRIRGWNLPCGRSIRRNDRPEIELAQEGGPRGNAVGPNQVEPPQPLAQHPIGFASSRRELANQVLGGTDVHRHRASRPLPSVDRGDVRGRHPHSSDTISFFAWIAASSVCHARLAHFTRTGNSDTPERTASLPRDPVSTGSPGRPVTILRNFSNNSCAWALDFPFTASVIREAEAFEIAHPWPTKATSAIVPSVSRT